MAKYRKKGCNCPQKRSEEALNDTPSCDLIKPFSDPSFQSFIHPFLQLSPVYGTNVLHCTYTHNHYRFLLPGVGGVGW